MLQHNLTPQRKIKVFSINGTSTYYVGHLVEQVTIPLPFFCLWHVIDLFCEMNLESFIHIDCLLMIMVDIHSKLHVDRYLCDIYKPVWCHI